MCNRLLHRGTCLASLGAEIKPASLKKSVHAFGAQGFFSFGAFLTEVTNCATSTEAFAVPIRPVELSRTPSRKTYLPGGRSTCSSQGKKPLITFVKASGFRLPAS